MILALCLTGPAGASTRMWDSAAAQLPARTVDAAMRFSARMSARQRGQVRAAVAAGRPAARDLLRLVDGDVHVRAHERGAFSYGGGLTFAAGRRMWSLDFAAVHLADVRVRGHVFWHEVGHLVAVSGLDRRGERALLAVLRRSARWRTCFALPARPGRCVPTQEIIADQIAFWATADRHVQSGYGLVPMGSRAAVGAVLARHLRLRPASDWE